MSPKIKICGVCDPLEARRIEELGADYVGMIFTVAARVSSISAKLKR